MSLNTTIEHWLTTTKKISTHSKRPFVTLSYAQSLDGSIALGNSEPLALSCGESLRLTHQLRSMHDGILVGIGTVLSDDPQLTVRHWQGNNPQPIVLDSQLRIPADAKLRNLPGKPCWVLTTRDHADHYQDLDAEGLQINLLQKDEQGRVCLRQALELLHKKGIGSVMVEGGASVITAFLNARLVDAVVLTITPKLIGGYKGVGDLQFTSKVSLPALNPFYSERLGDDLIVWGKLDYPDLA